MSQWPVLFRTGLTTERTADRSINLSLGNEPMTTPTNDEKTRKRTEHLQKRRAALVKAMEKDVRQLRKIIHGRAAKSNRPRPALHFYSARPFLTEMAGPFYFLSGRS